MITIIKSCHPTARKGYVAVLFGEQSEPAIYVPQSHEGFPIYKKFSDAAEHMVPGLLVEAHETLEGMILHETE